jgi:hypothetical protein
MLGTSEVVSRNYCEMMRLGCEISFRMGLIIRAVVTASVWLFQVHYSTEGQ